MYQSTLYVAGCMCLEAYMSVNVRGIQTYSCTSIKTVRSECDFCFAACCHNV